MIFKISNFYVKFELLKGEFGFSFMRVYILKMLNIYFTPLICWIVQNYYAKEIDRDNKSRNKVNNKSKWAIKNSWKLYGKIEIK